MKRIRSIPLTIGVGLLLVVATAALPHSQDAPSRHRGFVLPSQQVELNTPLEEILAEVVVKEGQRFAKDDLLAKLDDGLQAVVVDAARVRAESVAEVERTALDVDLAQLNLERLTTAFDQDAATDLEMRRARIELGRAQALHKGANENQTLAAANLSLEEERLSRYEVRAPFDGTLIKLITEPGAMLRETDKIMLVAALHPLEAQIDLPIEIFGDLTLGETQTLSADHPVNRRLQARLTYINPIIDTASETFRCVFEIDNPDRLLPAGFTVHLEWPGR